MAEIFPSLDEFKRFVGGRMNKSIQLASMEATIYETARRHIVPTLGATLYAELVANAGLSAEKEALLEKVKRPLALLTLYEYSKVAQVEFGERGFLRFEGEKEKGAYRYQVRAFQEDCLQKGYDAIEEVLAYLDANKSNASFTAWAATTEGLAHRTPLLNYAGDMRALAMPECDRWTFETIRPIISMVELLSVQKLVPAGFWTGMQARHLAGTLTTAEKTLRTYWRQSIAHRSIQEAVRQKWVRIEGGRISVMEDYGDQRSTNLTMPTTTGGGLYTSHGEVSDIYTSVWVEYMKNNVASFSSAFDDDSGGTNADSDAWHINTEEEEEAALAAAIKVKKKPVFRL